ncbi:MAG TPA: hypothetical protein VMV49_13755 [Candidatus Deferrimicrobium sp.]|nr:hypothetical protein [Candidatus Deferrimicrobium sp.]
MSAAHLAGGCRPWGFLRCVPRVAVLPEELYPIPYHYPHCHGQERVLWV